MLTEKGFDEALRSSDIPATAKESLPTKSYEVQKIVRKLLETPRRENYQPFDRNRKLVKTVREAGLRVRGFRQAVIEVYDFRCAICGLKINSPDSLCWEVEAAHIVPHSSFGRDDLFNGIGAGSIIGHSTLVGLRCSTTTNFRSRRSFPNCRQILVACGIMN